MADKKQETIADVVRKIRHEIAELRKVSPNVRSIAADWWEARADEIEAAHKREIEATAAKCCQLGRLAGYGASEIKHQQESVGNAAKLREACANIAEYARSAQCHTEDAHVLGYLNQIEGWAEAALSAPPRNCDVGTADEQSQRFDAFCDANKYVGDDGANWCSPKCPCSNSINCGVVWAQMPYEEGGAE